MDDLSRPGSITNDIVEGIIDADIIIADLTSQSPNVFYELGIAHAVGNKTIMVSQRIEDVPFDIANYRVILYEQTISGSKELAERLEAAIKELLAALDRTNNPVQSVLGTRSALHFKQRVPLFKAVEFALLGQPIKDLLTEKGITYLDELKHLDLDELAKRPGFGKISLARIAYIFLIYELYESPEEFSRFIQRHSLRFSGVDHWSREKWSEFRKSIKNLRASI